MNIRTWEAISESAAQTVALGWILGEAARSGDVLALVGELGAGKTQFVRGLAGGLGIDPAAVASPTFVMVREYVAAQGRPVLVHIDAYRLKSLEDLESIGWEGLSGGELRDHAVVAVEWADRLGESLGEQVLEIAFAHEGERRRRVVIRPRGQWIQRMADLQSTLDRAMRS